MAQVLQQQYENAADHASKVRKLNTVSISKQTIYVTITSIVLGAWIMASYLCQLFLKEAIISSLIIAFLVYIKTKSIKKE